MEGKLYKGKSNAHFDSQTTDSFIRSPRSPPFRLNGFFGLAIILSLLFLIAGCSQGNPDYTISGDSIFVDNSDAYLEITPHTLTGDGYVTFNVTPKSFTGNVDIVFGFDSEVAKPLSAELFKPRYENYSVAYRCDEPLRYNTSGKHLWCWNDITGVNGTTSVLVYETDFDRANVPAGEVYLDYQEYKLWKDISGHFEKTNYDFQGYDKWYYATNLPVVAGEDYSMRIYIESEYMKNIKYWAAIKPSSKSISQAIADDNFYYIDPWINATKTNYVNITATNTRGYMWKEFRQVDISLNATTNGTIGFTFTLPASCSGCNYSLGYMNDLDIGIGQLELRNTTGGLTAFYVFNTTYPAAFVTSDVDDRIANTTYYEVGSTAWTGNANFEIQNNYGSASLAKITGFGNEGSTDGQDIIWATAGQGLEVVMNSGGTAYSCANPILDINSDAYKRWRCSDATINITREVYANNDYFLVSYNTSGLSNYGGNANRQSSDIFLANQNMVAYNGTNSNITDVAIHEYSPTNFVQNASIDTRFQGDIVYWMMWDVNQYYVNPVATAQSWYRVTMRDNEFFGGDGTQGRIDGGSLVQVRHGVSTLGVMNTTRIVQEWDKWTSPFTITVSEVYLTSPASRTATTFGTGYPQINATDGLNSTTKNLHVTWIAYDVDPGDVLNYTVEVFNGNKKNFSNPVTATPGTGYSYTNGTYITFVINASNLTYSKGTNWSAQIGITGNETILGGGVYTLYANTSQLVIVNSAPSLPTQVLPPTNYATANYTTNLVCNGSTDNEGDTIFYEFYADLETDPATTLLQNSTSTSYNYDIGADGIYYTRCRANDQSGASGFTSSRGFVVDRRALTQLTTTFNSSAFSGTNQTFLINVTVNRTLVSDINATLVNGSTILTTHKELLPGDVYRFTTTRITPSTDTQYFWNVSYALNNGTFLSNTSTTLTQAVSVLSLYDCTSSFTNASSMLAFNFSSKNEDNGSQLYMDWEGTLITFFSDRTLNNTYTYGVLENRTNVKICSSPADASFVVDGDIYYRGLDPGTGTYLQEPRHYYFYNDLAGNSTGVQDINLNLLDTARGTDIKFQLLDVTDIGIPNAIINIQKKNVGNNTYETVAMGKTDDNGETVITLRLNDRVYKPIIKLPSTEIVTKADTTFSSSTFIIRLSESAPIEKIFDLKAVTTTITFNNATKTFTATFNDPNNKISSGCFAVTKYDANVTNSVVYNECIVATSGTFNVNVGDNNSTQYHSLIYANRNPSLILQILNIDLRIFNMQDQLGNEGIMFTLLIMLSLVMLGLWKPEISVAMSIFGIIISVVFGFFYMTIGTAFAFVISGAMFIWRLNKR